MRIAEAWQRLGVSGKNTTIAVVDDTLDVTNKELKRRILRNHDVTDNVTNKPEDERRWTHGTDVMSVAAGEGNNSYCGVGVAYEAFLIGINPLSAEKVDEKMSRAFRIAAAESDIAVAAWGPEPHVYSGPKESLRIALKQAETARDGRGLIIVHAAGNGGYNDDCAYDGYSTSPIMLSVTSVYKSLKRPLYNEKCSSALITAYTSSVSRYDNNLDSLVWTSGSGSNGGYCKNDFSATSASAALITGVSSLLIDANPALSWRDVQYIFALTARVFGEMESVSFQFNSAGLAFNKFFGFGLADAYGAVRLALSWPGVGPRKNCSITSLNTHSNSTFRVRISAINCLVRYVEHVTLALDLKSSSRQNLRATITSPSGITSSILSGIVPDTKVKNIDLNFSSKDNANWPFMTVHFWGEKALGDWIIRVEPKSSFSNFVSATLSIYGTDVEAPIYLRSCRLEDDSETEDITFKDMFGVWVSLTDNRRLQIKRKKLPQACHRCVCPTAEFFEDGKLDSSKLTFASGYARDLFNKSSLHFYPVIYSDLTIIVDIDYSEKNMIIVNFSTGNNTRKLKMRKENRVNLQETTNVDKTQTESIQTESTLTSTASTSSTLSRTRQSETTKNIVISSSKAPKTIYEHSNEFHYYLIIIIFLSLVIAALVISLIIVTAKVKRLEKRKKRQGNDVHLHLFKNVNVL
ncbi:unnamed protein product [Dimorphilus gyrociliatus]|uniref:P/Homo B domain-containing protein n=1 Tax=Dimorphilus gyrociliatus TaxID=2664684 RepID=A0A7I8VJQ4_9ANNE|nr:unnamed protein product [Dimorphilus gyrociliatus]